MNAAAADDDEDRMVDVMSPEVPEEIRQAVLARNAPDATLWRCPRRSGLRGPLSWLGIGQRRVIIEWWLLSADGELIGAFWLT